MFPNIPLTYREREKEISKLDTLYIDRKNVLHTAPSLSSTPRSRDIQTRLTTELRNTAEDDAVGQVNICWKYFSEIIKHTTTHQQVLERIKGEYEEALFSKEEQLSNDPLLPSPLSHAVTATRDELEKSHLRVSKKEAELYKLYHGNKELQQQLSNQIRSLSDLEKQRRVDSKVDLQSHNLSSHTNLANLPQKEQVEKLHVLYHEQEEVLCDLKDELRRKYVPASECKHIEMCISDVEVVIQKETRYEETLKESLSESVQQISSLLIEIALSPQDAELIIQSILNDSIQSLPPNLQHN